MLLPVQPYLFETFNFPPIPDDEVRRKGNSVVRKLRDVEKRLAGGETAYRHIIDEAVKKIRSVSRLSDSQRESLVLHAIERCEAETLAEIVEDTKLDKSVVNAILADLGTKGILYCKKRPGGEMGGRPQFIIKSRRAGEVR